MLFLGYKSKGGGGLNMNLFKHFSCLFVIFIYINISFFPLGLSDKILIKQILIS